MEESRFNVQCPSVHVETRSRLEMLALFGEELVDKIEKGILMSAPGISREDCGDCQFDRERQERLAREYDMDRIMDDDIRELGIAMSACDS